MLANQSMLLIGAGNGYQGECHLSSYLFLCVIWRLAGYCLKDSGINTNLRYWLQSQDELNHNWYIRDAGAVGSSKGWMEWLVVSASKHHVTSWIQTSFSTGSSVEFKDRYWHTDVVTRKCITVQFYSWRRSCLSSYPLLRTLSTRSEKVSHWDPENPPSSSQRNSLIRGGFNDSWIVIMGEETTVLYIVIFENGANTSTNTCCDVHHLIVIYSLAP